MTNYSEDILQRLGSPELIRLSWILHESPRAIIAHYYDLGVTATLAIRELRAILSRSSNL